MSKDKNTSKVFGKGGSYGRLVDFLYDQRIQLEGNREGRVINQYDRTLAVYIPEENSSVTVKIPLTIPKNQWGAHIYTIVDKRYLDTRTTKQTRQCKEAEHVAHKELGAPDSYKGG